MVDRLALDPVTARMTRPLDPSALLAREGLRVLGAGGGGDSRFRRRRFTSGLAKWTRWFVQCVFMATRATGEQYPSEQTAATVEVLQAATRVLTGVALRSLDTLGGTVSLPQFRVLAVLGDIGRARSATVARALGLDASTITRLADRLVAAGHVARGIEPGNRTVVTLELTATGQDLVAQVGGWRRQELARIIGRLAPVERQALTAALRRLVDAAGDGYGAVSGGPVSL